jgi:hypothetical protein
MSKSEYARYRHVSPPYISKLARNGILVIRGTKVDVAATDKVLDDRPLQEIPEPAPATPNDAAPQRTTYAEARTIREVFRARLARLDFETRQGRLIEAAAVRTRIQEHLAAIRAGLEGLAERLAGPIAAQGDARKVRALMTTEIRAELVRISAIVGGGPNAGAPPEA